jgi:hypothetical protein
VRHPTGEDCRRTGEACHPAGEDCQQGGWLISVLAKFFGRVAKIFSVLADVPPS